MDNSVLVSVIIPCYNVVSYVERAVKSILNQSYTNLEIIIVDDASTDGTLEILENINDSRITLLKFKKNTKKIGAVNEALKLASGNLIALQDADDWSDLKRIEKQVHQFTNDRTFGICFTNYRYAHQLNNPIKAIALTDLELKDEFLKFGSKEYKHLAPTMCATMMITREALIETSGYHPYFAGRVAEDIHWVYRILKKYKGISLNEPLYNITAHSNSLTGQQLSGLNAKAAYSWILLAKIIKKDIEQNIDILDQNNKNDLVLLELEACEEALVNTIREALILKNAYEDSASFRIGKLLLMPYKLIKKTLSL